MSSLFGDSNMNQIGRKLLIATSLLAYLGAGTVAEADRIKRPKTTPAPPVFALDSISTGTIAVAYSVRRLRTAYTGPVFEVTRASDSTTTNISPLLNGDPNLAQLGNFCAATVCSVDKWYDQNNGTNCNAVQPTLALQWNINLADTTLNNRLSFISVDSALTHLDTPASCAAISNMMATDMWNINVITALAPVTQVGRVWSKGQNLSRIASTASRSMLWMQGATISGNWFFPTLAISSHVVDTEYSSLALTNVPVMTYDGVAQTFNSPVQPTGTIVSDAANGLTLFNDATLLRSWVGNFSEVIFFRDAIPSAGDMTTLRTNEKAYFGTP